MLTPRHRHADSCHDEEAGFTLVEMMVSIGVFGVLMAIMGTATLNAFNTINSVTETGDTQMRISLAAEQASRMFRYASRPDPSRSAIASASTTSITFYTYSGTGSVGDVPYKVTIRTVTVGDHKKVMATTCRPTAYGKVLKSGSEYYLSDYWNTYVSGSSCTNRILLTVPATAVNPFTVTITQCARATYLLCYPGHGRSNVTLGTTDAALTFTGGAVPDTVTFTMGDKARTSYLIRHQVGLVNSMGLVNSETVDTGT